MMIDISNEERRFAHVLDENYYEGRRARVSWADESEQLQPLGASESGISKTPWTMIVSPQNERIEPTPESNALDTPIVKIDFEDIRSEVEYWEPSVVAYVLGCNPSPLNVMEGYFKRIWGKCCIDRVASLKKGVFIVRFHSMENQKKALEDDYETFDKKTVIVQPWSANMNI